MIQCHRTHRRAFWTMRLSHLGRGESGSGKIRPPHVLQYCLVCVPDACDIASVGHWLGPAALTTDARDGQISLFSGAASWLYDTDTCRPGHIRLPVRFAVSAS